MMVWWSYGQAYAHMERVNGNLIAAQKLLMTALSLEPENAAVLMVRTFLFEVVPTMI